MLTIFDNRTHEACNAGRTKHSIEAQRDIETERDREIKRYSEGTKRERECVRVLKRLVGAI